MPIATCLLRGLGHALAVGEEFTVTKSNRALRRKVPTGLVLLGFAREVILVTLVALADNDRTRILGWLGCKAHAPCAKRRLLSRQRFSASQTTAERSKMADAGGVRLFDANPWLAAREIHHMRRALLLPVFFITYALAYVDRANYGFGAAAGMARALHLTESRSALLAALFFLGYCAFQVPGMLLARRWSVSRLAFLALILWGALAALTGVIRGFAWLALDRLLLGVAESIIFPAMLLLLTHWFVRAERSRANTYLILANPITVLGMSAITGFLIQSVGWQRMFVIEGLPAVLWAFPWIAVMRDHPTEAAWMDPEQAARLELEIRAQQPDLALPEGERALLRSILLRRDVLQLCLQYFCWSLGVYGFVLWLPTIVRRGAELSMGSTGLLSAAPYLLAVPLMILAGRIADRTLRPQQVVWPFLLLAGVAMLGSFFLAEHSFPLAFVCLVLAGGCMFAPYGPFFAILPERAPQEVVGEAFALVNSFGALGGFAGSYLVGLLHAVTGSQAAGYLLMSLALLAAALLVYRLPRLSAASSVRELHHA